MKITIPTPCNSNWIEMPSSGNGRFCSQCRKTVIDFTGFSTEDLKAYFQKKPGQICGRFLDHQLENQEVGQGIEKANWLKRTILAAIISSVSVPISSDAATLREISISGRPGSVSSQHEEDTVGTGMISGVVVDKSQKPIVAARIALRNSSLTTLTDNEGRFEIHPGSILKETLILDVSSIVFISGEIYVGSNRQLVIELGYVRTEPSVNEVLVGRLGGVVVRTSFWSRLRWRLGIRL